MKYLKILHMEKTNVADLKSRILQGLEISFKKLVHSKSKDDRELIYSHQGKIIKIKAKEIK
jgi:hypothetical protein